MASEQIVTSDPNPVVGIVMGSQSDWETMRHCADTLAELGIAHEVRIISAHRTPDRMTAYCANLREIGRASCRERV